MYQTRLSVSRTQRAIEVTVMPERAITRTCASKGAARWELGRASQGMSTVLLPCSPQSTLGTAQCTIVSYCQMSRWRQVRSRVSQTPQGLPQTGHLTACPGTLPTLTWSSSGAPSRSSNQTSSTLHSGPSPIDLSKSCASIPACASTLGSDRRRPSDATIVPFGGAVAA